MRYGDDWVKRHDLSSLRLLGTVGEPINPEAWKWYHNIVGGGRCPIMDTWWQTETGGMMITPLPALPLKPGSATHPFPGIEVDVVDDDGQPLPAGRGWQAGHPIALAEHAAHGIWRPAALYRPILE